MSNTIRWMMKRDLPDVITLAQIDPELRAMGKDAENYLRSIMSSSDGYGYVYDECGIIEGLSLHRLNPKRITVLHLVGTTHLIMGKLIEHKIAKLSGKRRFLDLELDLSLFNAPIIRWAAEKGGLIRSIGVEGNSVTVTFSRPLKTGEGIPVPATC